ncbi:MAG: hypothetical protein FWE75_22435, partial [Actinomycetia bacterium]|nr:hypothetical protein [Actinomycetes bacterium]
PRLFTRRAAARIGPRGSCWKFSGNGGRVVLWSLVWHTSVAAACCVVIAFLELARGKAWGECWWYGVVCGCSTLLGAAVSGVLIHWYDIRKSRR